MLSIFKKLYAKFFGNEKPIPPGETELDYIPLDKKKISHKPVKITKIEKYKSKTPSLEQEIC
jgi:hypothetical protein